MLSFVSLSFIGTQNVQRTKRITGNNLWDVGRAREEFVNHEPQENDLRILRVKTCGLFHEFTRAINHS